MNTSGRRPNGAQGRRGSGAPTKRTDVSRRERQARAAARREQLGAGRGAAAPGSGAGAFGTPNGAFSQETPFGQGPAQSPFSADPVGGIPGVTCGPEIYGDPGRGRKRRGRGGRSGRNNGGPGRKKGRVWKIVLAVILGVLLVGGGVAFAYYGEVVKNLHRGIDDNLRGALDDHPNLREPFYMLLLGTDKSKQRESENSLDGSYRSDSMILARIDATSKKVTLISLHRDTLMEFGDKGRQKLNAAYSIGGPALTVQTVSKLAGVPISHYAEINFDGFKDIVDALGGIEVDVPMDIDDPDAGGSLKAGPQTLDGAQALILCRARHAYDDYGDGDVYRAANQRLVMAGIAKKLLSADVGTIAATVEKLSRYVSTDFEPDQIVALAEAFRGMDVSRDIYSAMEPTISKFVPGDGWYEYCDVTAWQAMMKRVNQGLPPVEKSQVDSSGTLLSQAGDGVTGGQKKGEGGGADSSVGSAGSGASSSNSSSGSDESEE